VEVSGIVTVTDGTLDVGNRARSFPGGLTMTGGIFANGTSGNGVTTAVTLNNGEVRAVLVSTSSVSVVTGSNRLYPKSAAGSSSYTGNTAVAQRQGHRRQRRHRVRQH